MRSRENVMEKQTPNSYMTANLSYTSCVMVAKCAAENLRLHDQGTYHLGASQDCFRENVSYDLTH